MPISFLPPCTWPYAGVPAKTTERLYTGVPTEMPEGLGRCLLKHQGHWSHSKCKHKTPEAKPAPSSKRGWGQCLAPDPAGGSATLTTIPPGQDLDQGPTRVPLLLPLFTWVQSPVVTHTSSPMHQNRQLKFSASGVHSTVLYCGSLLHMYSTGGQYRKVLHQVRRDQAAAEEAGWFENIYSRRVDIQTCLLPPPPPPPFLVEGIGVYLIRASVDPGLTTPPPPPPPPSSMK